MKNLALYVNATEGIKEADNAVPGCKIAAPAALPRWYFALTKAAG